MSPRERNMMTIPNTHHTLTPTTLATTTTVPSPESRRVLLVAVIFLFISIVPQIVNAADLGSYLDAATINSVDDAVPNTNTVVSVTGMLGNAAPLATFTALRLHFKGKLSFTCPADYASWPAGKYAKITITNGKSELATLPSSHTIYMSGVLAANSSISILGGTFTLHAEFMYGVKGLYDGSALRLEGATFDCLRSVLTRGIRFFYGAELNSSSAISISNNVLTASNIDTSGQYWILAFVVINNNVTLNTLSTFHFNNNSLSVTSLTVAEFGTYYLQLGNSHVTVETGSNFTIDQNTVSMNAVTSSSNVHTRAMFSGIPYGLSVGITGTVSISHNTYTFTNVAVGGVWNIQYISSSGTDTPFNIAGVMTVDSNVITADTGSVGSMYRHLLQLDSDLNISSITGRLIVSNNVLEATSLSISNQDLCTLVYIKSGGLFLSDGSALSIINNTMHLFSSTAWSLHYYGLHVPQHPFGFANSTSLTVSRNSVTVFNTTASTEWRMRMINFKSSNTDVDTLLSMETLLVSGNTMSMSNSTFSGSNPSWSIDIYYSNCNTTIEAGSTVDVSSNVITASIPSPTPANLPALNVFRVEAGLLTVVGELSLHDNNITFQGAAPVPVLVNVSNSLSGPGSVSIQNNILVGDDQGGLMLSVGTLIPPHISIFMCQNFVGSTLCSEEEGSNACDFTCVSTATNLTGIVSHQCNPASITTTTLSPYPVLQYVASYFGHGTHRARYPDHTPTSISGAVSGLPLLFSTSYRTVYAARFQITDVFNTAFRLGINATAGTSYFTRMSVTKAASFDGVALDSALCTQFVHPTTGAVTNTSSVGCGVPMTCMDEPSSTATGNHLSDSVTITANPGSLTATCGGGGALLSGLVYASAPLTQRVFQSYALVSANAAHASISASAAASAFVGSNSYWLGSPATSVTGVTGTTTMYLVGDASNPTGTNIPVLEQYLAPMVVTNGPSSDLTATSGTTSYCALPDQSAFDATFIEANTSVSSGGVPTSCFTFDSVDTLHTVCMATAGCVGFSTIRVHHRELPLCLHLSGSNIQPATYRYDRIFYRKPPSEGQSCTVAVERSGRVAVYIQQTSFGRGGAQAVVHVDSTVVSICGGSQSFSNGFAGMSGRCQLFALCYAGAVSARAKVTVSVQGAVTPNGCNNSLGVLVSQTSVDLTQVAATTIAPIERVNVDGATSRIVRLASGVSLQSLPLFVYGASTVAMEVMQTGHDCSIGGCASHTVTMRTAGTCQRCGGEAGFFRGSRAGLSDQCDTGMFCGSNMSLHAGSSDLAACETPGTIPSTTLYTGHVRVSVDPSTLRSRTSQCTGFIATLYTTPQSTSTLPSTVPVYPLLNDDGSTFRTLLTAPSTLSPTDAISYVVSRSGLPSTTLTSLFNVGPYGNQVMAFYAPSLSTTTTSTPQTTLHVNTTLACVVDHNAGLSAKCVLPIPLGSLKVRVLVAQNDYALNANQLSVTILSGSSVRTSLQCGGSQRFGFDGGAQELCSDYRVCTDRYLYTDDVDAETATDGYLTVEIPANIQPRGCNFTASIIAEFTKPQGLVPFMCSTYECEGERKCIPLNSVCDSVQDCASNTDEVMCTSWRALDRGSTFCVPLEHMTNYTGSTYLDCRRRAVINTTSVFALIGTKCVVYSSTISTAILESPSDYVCDVEGAIGHVRLPPGATFSLCTSSTQCFGNGIASSNSSTGACSCTCVGGYIGPTCTERLSLANIQTIIVALQTPLNMSLRVNLATLGDVLALNYTTVTVTCDIVLPSPLYTTAETIHAECTVASDTEDPAAVYVHQRRLLEPASWSAATAILTARGAPGIQYVTARTTMQPILPIIDCSGTSCTSTRPYNAIRLISLAATALESATLAVTDVSSTSTSASRVGAQHRALSCTPASTNVGGGCVLSACDLDLSGTANTNINVSATTFASPSPITGTCTAVGVSLQTHGIYGNIPTLTNDTVLNNVTNFDWFLIGSVLMFVIGFLVSIVVCIALLCIYRRRRDAFVGDVDFDKMTPAERLKASLLGHLAYIQHCAEGFAVRLDRVSVGLGTFSVLCAVAASSLTIYYVTAYSRNSNFSVMYEEYTDIMCGSSPTASMPRRIYSIPHASSECTRMAITGETAGVVFADGNCEGGGGAYSAVFRSGGTFLTCMTTASTTVASGTCLPVSSINPSDTRSVYVQLSCSTRQQISQRTTTLAKITTVEDVFVQTPTADLHADLIFASRPGGPPTSEGGTVFMYPYLSNGVIKNTTSTRSMTVSSTATAECFDRQYNPSRMVLQRFPDSFQNINHHQVSFPAAEEASALPLMANLSETAAVSMMPLDGDYGVGYLYGGFGTSSELTWQGAGPQAHRHYDIRGTNFDVAHHLPTSVDELADGAGFSVSMHLRASNTTKGFAFAVTDAFENTQAGTIYTLDRLAEMIENGQASSAWFASTYRVYASLFVSGPTRQLTFAHADPSETDRVQLLDWDMDRIGAQYLFNGLWHHVAVVYRVENGQLRATLIVDGATSYAAEGWSVCADRLPPVVQSFPNVTTPVFDQSSDKASDGGLLVVGYFNGGVYGLTATPFEMLNTNYLVSGTAAMRKHNAFPRTSTLALGVILVLLGLLALVFVVAAGCIDIRRIQAKASLAEGRQIMRDFLTLQRTATSATTLFGTDVDPVFPLAPIRLSTALRWTGLVINQIATLPVELVNQTSQPGEQLLLVLYNSLTNERRTEITPTEWNTLVDDDATNRATGKRYCCLEHKTDAEKDAQLTGTSEDIFIKINNREEPDGTDSQRRTDCFSSGEEDNVEMNTVEHRRVHGRVTEITTVDMKPSRGGGGSDSGVLKTLVDVLAPVIVVFQSMYVWSTSIEFPSLYDDYFSNIFSFVSIDVAATFPGIPTIATPLAQMALGFLVVAIVIYFVFEDHRRFESSLAKYVWRRDAIEANGEETLALHKSLPTTLTSVLEDHVVVEPMMQLRTLPVSDCRMLDLITDKIPKLDEDDTTDYTAIDRTTVKTLEGTEYTVARDSKNHKHLVVEGGGGDENKRLDPIGCHCWRHPNTPLTSVQQSDVYPFSNPSTCCCVVNGRLCGVQVGVMYVCGDRYANDDGNEVMCTFGLCESHCRMTLKDNVVASVYGMRRRVLTNGLPWLVAVGILLLVNTIYTPFLKTALMIIACHPQYQCEFEHCWTFITQEFALAAFLSASVVLVLGLGFPALLMMQLLRRRVAFNTAFFGEEYGDAYATRETRGPEFKLDSWFRKKKELSNTEWARFSASDNSALALQYFDASYRWLMMPALVLLFKVLVLIPAVFLEPRSFDLRLGCGLVEIGIAIFYFATNTQLSPILLMTIRAASVHQLLFLGFQNIDLVTDFDRNMSLSPLLIAITVTYIVFSALVFIVTVIYPVVAIRSDKKHTTKFLNRHHLDNMRNISLYVEPQTDVSSPIDSDDGRRVDNKNPFAANKTSRRKSSVLMPHDAAQLVSLGGSDYDECGDILPHHQAQRSSIFQSRRRSSVGVGEALAALNDCNVVATEDNHLVSVRVDDTTQSTTPP